MVFTASLLGVWHLVEVVENKPEFACCVLGQGTQWDASSFMWKTGGPVFPLKKGLMENTYSSHLFVDYCVLQSNC